MPKKSDSVRCAQQQQVLPAQVSLVYPRVRKGVEIISTALAALTTVVAHAQNVEEAATPMREVTVTATRTEQDVHDVANTVTIITSERIAEEMPGDVQDLLRYETGVSVRALPNRSSAVFYNTGRGGNEGINIRGLEGNQVLLQTDGVRLPSAYSSGPFSSGRGDFIDVEAYKRVEILRGPTSTQFGSDGLAGAVSFLTKDPADLLTLGKPIQASIKTGFSSVDEGWSVVPSVAARGEMFEGMILGSFKRGHAPENHGSNGARNFTRTEPNPQDTKYDYVLAKLVMKVNPRHRFKLTAENLDREVDTTVLTLFGDPMYLTTTGVAVREDITRELYKLDYDYNNIDNPFFQRLSASIYTQDSKNSQWGYEARSNTTGWNTRNRTTAYEEEARGGSLQFESNFGQEVSHRVVYGVDASLTDVTSLKEGNNYLNGNLVTTGANAFVKNRSFPNTEYRLLGAFIQDEIGIGRLSIIPGVRYESFKLSPEADELYRVNNKLPPATLDDSAISPKIGVIWKQNPLLNLFGQYSHGFRAPTPTQVNGGVTNLTASLPYMSTGNPNLKAETSKSFEVGIRGRSNTVRYSTSIFHSRYKDFISANQQVSGKGTVADPIVYQSVNLSEVEISGFELGGEWSFAPNWSVSGSYAWTRGDEKTANGKKPLNTIDPAKLVLGLRYEQQGLYGGQVMGTFVERKHRNPDSSRYTPGSYQTFDLMGWYHFNKNASLNVGVFNLFDEKYFQWADVRDVSATSSIIDAYSQPRRNFSASLRYQF